MIFIAEAVENVTWVAGQFEPKSTIEKEAAEGGLFCFRLRLLDFSRLDQETLSREFKSGIESSRTIWQLRVEMMNLCKKAIHAGSVSRRLVILDQDGFEYVHIFKINSDRYASWHHSTYKTFHDTAIPPKVTRSGVVAFELAEDYEQGRLTIRNGTLSEV